MKRTKILLNKYIVLIFIISLWHTNIFAYQVSKTPGGADIKWFIPHAIYYINPSGGPTNNLSAIQASMQTWTDVDTSDFTFIYGGTTTNASAGTNDGVNIVCFGPMGSNSTLAQNSFWYDTNSGRIIDSDIQFNTSYIWRTDGSSGAYDVQNIGTHEFGHSLSLADLYNAADSEKTMYGYGSAGETKKRSLHQDDIDGITYLYPDATPPVGTITINSSNIYTRYTSVTLTLSCSDTGGNCAQMQFSNNNTNWSSPEAYAITKIWTLSSGDGLKTVYVKFSDNADNWSNAYSDTIILDTIAPTTTASPSGGTYSSAQRITLSCNDGNGSGCGNIYYTTDGSTPTTTSPVYSVPINIFANTTLKFFAFDSSGNQEFVKAVTYIFVIPLTVTTSSLPAGIVGNPYNRTLIAMGGIPPYIWSITSGNLPDGLNLNSSTGVISGLPTTDGSYNFVVQITDTVPSTAIKNLSIIIYLSQDLPVKESSSYYSSVQDAYDACSDGNIIQIQDVNIYEDLVFDRDISITLKGGYNSDFTNNASYTTIHGTMTFEYGTVEVENIIVQ
jgi:hypothetical protein